MRIMGVFAVVCGVLVGPAATQEQAAESRRLFPTILEMFAMQSTASVTWSQEVGRIESTEAQATIFALAVEDPVQPPHLMRGVRIDLIDQRGTDHVYVEEGRLGVVRTALYDIERNRAGSEHLLPQAAAVRYWGSAELREVHPVVRSLNAAYYAASDSAGLVLSAHGGRQFRFPDRSPSELALALGKAIEKLRTLG